MQYLIPKKLKEETKLFSFGHGTAAIYLKDVLFLVGWALAAVCLRNYVHTWLTVPFFLFMACAGIYLVIPAKASNPGKRHWEAMLLMLGRDRGVIPSVSPDYLERSFEVE